jgi:hypothetical protein
MKYIILGFIFLIIITERTTAQGWMPQGAISAGLGNSSVTLVDLFAFHHNPGALGFLEKGGGAVSYESRYLLRELQTQGFSLAQPIQTGVISLGGQFYGYETFRTNRVGAGYALKLANNISAGVQLNYMSLRLDPSYGVKHTVSGEIGMLARIGEDVSVGFSAFNIGRARLSEFKDDRFSTLLRLGTSYQLTEELLVLIELEQEVSFNTRLRGGIEYNYNERFYFRAGAQGAPVEFSFGAGYRWGLIQLDLASHYHQLLGWTPSANLIVNFQKKSTE